MAQVEEVAEHQHQLQAEHAPPSQTEAKFPEAPPSQAELLEAPPSQARAGPERAHCR